MSRNAFLSGGALALVALGFVVPLNAKPG